MISLRMLGGENITATIMIVSVPVIISRPTEIVVSRENKVIQIIMLTGEYENNCPLCD